MTGKHLEIISRIVLWYENSFRIDWYTTGIGTDKLLGFVDIPQRLIQIYHWDWYRYTTGICTDIPLGLIQIYHWKLYRHTILVCNLTAHKRDYIVTNVLQTYCVFKSPYSHTLHQVKMIYLADVWFHLQETFNSCKH